MKKIAIFLLASLLVCVCAAAEVPRDTMELPEGFSWVDETEMEGYRQAATQDSGATYAGESLLAVRDGAAISLVSAGSEYADTRAAAEALLEEYAGYIDGFENVEAEYVEAGEREFARFQVALDGEPAAQYLLLENGTLYVLTFAGVDEAEALAVLESFEPAAPDATGAADAETDETGAEPAEDADAAETPDVTPEA